MANKKKPLPVDKKIEKLIEIYKEVEQRLIKTIAEKEVKGNVTTFYKEMLKQVQQELLRLKIFNTQWATDITKQLYMQAYEEQLKMLNIDDYSFTSLHKEAVELITNNMINNLNNAIDVVGRRTEDSIREIGLSSAVDKFATGYTIKQQQEKLKKELLDKNITCIKDKLGRNISIKSYASMVARSVVAETQNTCIKNVAKENGHDLVKMTSHSGACPVCAPYEGRVYSLSGKDKRFPYIKNVPGYSAGYNNIHPRCSHRISVWVEKYGDTEKEIKNSNKPFEIPKEKQDSINKYYEEQKKKAKLRANKKQYEQIKIALGNEAPKSFQGFLKMKNAKNQENYNDLKERFKKVRQANNEGNVKL